MSTLVPSGLRLEKHSGSGNSQSTGGTNFEGTGTGFVVNTSNTVSGDGETTRV